MPFFKACAKVEEVAKSLKYPIQSGKALSSGFRAKTWPVRLQTPVSSSAGFPFLSLAQSKA
ncbi:MAG: hypothetical protein DWQ01_02050 [Planctomycetota bacterium]|nr:MAG: hypothetical protein DWQ01_02050 [Planctomycetota bacterium]